MSRRDERLAAKYAAKGMKSATETNREKQSSKTVEDPMDAMRRAIAAPRTQGSLDNAAAHKRRLGPLPR